jgi:LuxR family maltose regulon positive regulatory protein
LCGIVYLALGRTMASQGDHDGAQEQLQRALELFGIDAMAVHRAHALLLLATVQHHHGDPGGARTLLARAHELIEQLADPGVLPTLLEQARRMLSPVPRRRVNKAAPLTERELVVLRLLPTRLSTSEISDKLHVSANTVRSQVQAIYRKLEVTTRSEAIAKARQTGLLPGSTTTDP